MSNDTWGDKGYAVYNPHGKPVEELPTIWGFNNGGEPEWWMACLLSDDGEALGSHLCSHEAYMRGDLGVLAGHRADRHETFRNHYPEKSHGLRSAVCGLGAFGLGCRL